MNGAQFHVIVNHVAIIGVPVAALVLGWGIIRNKPDVARVGLGVLAMVAASVLLAYLTGEPAEEVVESYNVDEEYIHAHEDFGTITTWLTGALAVLALGVLLAVRKTYRRGLAMLVLIAVLPVSGMLAWTGHLGGEIRHPEIRPGTSVQGDGGGHEEDESSGRDRGRGGDDGD